MNHITIIATVYLSNSSMPIGNSKSSFHITNNSHDPNFKKVRLIFVSLTSEVNGHEIIRGGHIPIVTL